MRPGPGTGLSKSSGVAISLPVSLILAWVIFLVVLLALSVGPSACWPNSPAGEPLPWTLLPATGFAGVIAVGVITCFPALAEATTGAVTGLAVAGYLAPLHGRPLRPGSQPAS